MTDLSKSPTQDHWALLALTRFLLSMIVYLGHLGTTIGYNELTYAWREYGEFAAVAGFFIISGFSIANSIEQRPKRYILRRFWRIWPTYLFSFFFCTLPAVFILPRYESLYPSSPQINGQHITGWLIVNNLFMLQGLFLPALEANVVTWTLAIEEWCYLSAPIFRRCSGLVIAAFIAISAYCYSHSEDFSWLRLASQTGAKSALAFAWAWLLGFYFFRYRTSILAQLTLFLLPVWLFCIANETAGKYSVFTLLATTLVIAYGGTIMSLTERLPESLVEMEWASGKVVSIKWIHIRNLLVFLGNVSFPLYIIHYPLFFLIFRLTKCRDHWTYITSVFLLSVAVYFVIDRPNRKRWQPKR